MSSTVEATIISRLRWDQKTNQPLSQTPSHSYSYTSDNVDDNYQLMLIQGTGQGRVNQVWHDTIELNPGYNSINLSSLILQTFDQFVNVSFNGGDIKAIVIKNLSSTYGEVTLPFSKNGSVFSGANQLEPSGKLVITNADGWKTTPNEKILFNFMFPTTIKISLIGSIYNAAFEGTIFGTSTEQAQLSVSGLAFSSNANIYGNLIDQTCFIDKFVNSVSKSQTSVTQGTISSSPILSGSTRITSTIIDISSTHQGHTALSIFGIPGTKVGTSTVTGVVANSLQRSAFVNSISNSTLTVLSQLIAKKTLGGTIEGYSSASSPPLVHILPSGNSQIGCATSGNITTDKLVNSNTYSQTNIQVSLSNDATLGGLCKGRSSEHTTLYTTLDTSGVASIRGHVTTPSVKTNKFVNSTTIGSIDISATDLINIKGLGGHIDANSSTSTGLLYTDIYLSARSQNLHNNLLSFYRFEEELGTRYDSISNNDLLAYESSQPNRKYGIAGYSTAFSGITTSGLYIVSGGNFTFETSNFTMAAWVKPIRQSGIEVIASRFSTTPADRSYEIVVTNANTARFSCYGPTTNSTAVVSGLSLNEWSLVVAWRDYENNTIGITVNNNLIQETGFDESLNSSDENFQLGGYYYSLLGIYGNIDLFSVWDRVLDSGEKTLLWNDNYGWNTSLNTVDTKSNTNLQGITTNLTNNLFSFWKFNEISGERANSSEKSYHLVDNSGVLYSPVLGKPGRCIKFAGVTGQVLSNDDSDFSLGGTDFSLSCWVQMTGSLSNTQIIMGKYNTDTLEREYALGFSSFYEGLYFSKSTDGTYQDDNTIVSTVPIATGEWYHLVGIHDATNNEISVIVDNTTDSKTMDSTTIGSYSSPFVIGGGGSKYSNLLKGRMDSAGLWTRVLTPTDITHLYNKGVGWDNIGTYSILSDVPQLSGTIIGVSSTSKPALDTSVLLGGTFTGISYTSLATLDWTGTTHTTSGTIIGTSTESATLDRVGTTHSIEGVINGISSVELAILGWVGTTHTLNGTLGGTGYVNAAILDKEGTTYTLGGSVIGTSSINSAGLDKEGTTHSIGGSFSGSSSASSALLDKAGTTHILSASFSGSSSLSSATLDVYVPSS